MKSTRLMVIVMLVALCAMSWMLFFRSATSETAALNETVQNARDNRDKKLYQLAVDAYNSAIGMEASEELYDELLDTCEAYYSDSHTNSVKKVLVSAFEAATKAYPKRADYWERYAQVYLENGDYAKAGTVLQKAMDSKASSEKLSAQWNQAYYAVKVNYRSFSYLSAIASDGLYIAVDDQAYGFIDTAAADVLSFAYRYIGPFGEDNLALAVNTDGEAALLDEDGVMYARFQASVVQAGGYGEGLIPVQLDGRNDWCYLDKTGKEVFGGYQAAGMFQDGVAAVQTAEGQWYLIDTEGKQSGDGTWEEILLSENGGYIHDGRCMMKSGGKWYLCQKDGEAVKDFSCDDMDIRVDGLIAFCLNGKWGYVSRAGKVIIEPVYDNAKSFSCGVGAVCKDGRWGFINEDGTLVVEYSFAEAEYFNEDGTCVVKMPDSGEYCLIQWYVER